MRNLALMLVAGIALFGCASIVADQEAQLDQAGFTRVAADTPERQALLANLPSRQFVRGLNGSFVTYTYADPAVCHCLYVGSDFAYRTYKGILRAHSSSAGVGGAGDNPNPNGGWYPGMNDAPARR